VGGTLLIGSPFSGHCLGKSGGAIGSFGSNQFLPAKIPSISLLLSLQLSRQYKAVVRMLA
jgi:hypothetical protein